MAPPIRIAVIIRPTWHIHREALLGVAEAITGGLGWHLDEHWPERMANDALAGCAGVLCGVFDHPRIAAMVAAARLPTIAWSSRFAGRATATVACDDRAIGRLAADHLLAQGYIAFAMLGDAGRRSDAERRAGFCERLGGLGHAVAAAELRDGQEADPAWLARLPAGTGLLLGHDGCARPVFAALEERGRRIGAEIGVLGVDADPFASAHVGGRLSSVRAPWREVGAASAALLARLLAGEPPPAAPLLLPPGNVVALASTRREAAQVSGDAILAWIAQNAHRPIDVGDIVRHTGLSRRTVERQIHHLTGRSPAGEIRRARIELAKAALLRRGAEVGAVAAACGFANPRQLSAALRAATGLTPAAWQERHRRR